MTQSIRLAGQQLGAGLEVGVLDVDGLDRFDHRRSRFTSASSTSHRLIPIDYIPHH